MRAVRKQFKTIKQYAEHLLTKTDYVDCWGRSVGLDYLTILSLIRRYFPEGRTSIRSLRAYLYTLDSSTRLPVRRRSHKILAREYARALLLESNPDGTGLALKVVSDTVKKKFPRTKRIAVKQLVAMLPALRRNFKSRVPRDRPR